MPVEFLQPFDFFFRKEDRHVIVFLAEHPTYEALEAFASAARGEAAVVHAVLTRHDQGQVDYVSDRAALTARRAARQRSTRETHVAAISFALADAPDGVGARVRFAASSGEEIVLELSSPGPALPALGGLTDPLGHAPDVLPIMHRRASTLGGPGTTLHIGGARCLLAAAYYTEGFAIGVLSAGVLEHRVTEQPDAIAAGARWVYAWDGGEGAYEIVTCDRDRLVIERRGERRERIAARVADGRILLEELRVASATGVPGEIVLSFDPFLPGPPAPVPPGGPARFAIAIDEHQNLVRGAVLPGTAGFTLLPEEPAWATRRALAVAVEHLGDARRVTTSVGGR